MMERSVQRLVEAILGDWIEESGPDEKNYSEKCRYCKESYGHSYYINYEVRDKEEPHNSDCPVLLARQMLVDDIQVGNIVVPINGYQLASGCCRYDAAIVISIAPFIIVSEHSDMRWSSVNKTDFKVEGWAPKPMFDKCMRRLEQ